MLDHDIKIHENLELTEFDWDMKFEDSLGQCIFEKKKTGDEHDKTLNKSKKVYGERKTTKPMVQSETIQARVLISTGPLDVEDDN